MHPRSHQNTRSISKIVAVSNQCLIIGIIFVFWYLLFEDGDGCSLLSQFGSHSGQLLDMGLGREHLIRQLLLQENNLRIMTHHDTS